MSDNVHFVVLILLPAMLIAVVFIVVVWGRVLMCSLNEYLMDVWKMFILFPRCKGIYGTCICIWLVKLLLTFSIALDNAWKSTVQCHSHKKCPISVNNYFCLLDLPLSKSMVKCISVIVDLLVSLCISQNTCFSCILKLLLDALIHDL